MSEKEKPARLPSQKQRMSFLAEMNHEWGTL